MSEFKLTHEEPGYEPPKTWEACAALDRPGRIKAARYFLRQAAVRLHEAAELHVDDVVMLFDAVPAWVSNQRHAWKRAQHEARQAWRCNACTFIAKKEEFFVGGRQQQHAICPECGKTDAEEISTPTTPGRREDGPLTGVKPADLAAVCDSFEDELGRRAAAAHLPDLCACDGQPCPVCESLGRKNIIIVNHSCIVCETLFCPKCHGIVTAGSSAAFDSCGRCKC